MGGYIPKKQNPKLIQPHPFLTRDVFNEHSGLAGRMPLTDEQKKPQPLIVHLDLVEQIIEIGREQRQNENITTARETFNFARELALRIENTAERADALYQVANAQAISNFTKDAKDTRSILGEQTLLTPEAAFDTILAEAIKFTMLNQFGVTRAILKLAIKSALSFSDNEQKINMLTEIMYYQNVAGFINDARETRAILEEFREADQE